MGTLCRPIILIVLVTLGSAMTGLLSVGIGETTTIGLNSQSKLPMIVAAGTSVLVVTVTVLASSITELVVDLSSHGEIAIPFEIVMWTMPGVLIGGQIGAKLCQYVSHHTAEMMLVIILYGISIIMGCISV